MKKVYFVSGITAFYRDNSTTNVDTATVSFTGNTVLLLLTLSVRITQSGVIFKLNVYHGSATVFSI